ncbi:hypothetical protein BEWA_009900 [Theileria equi strain WA]|uniref:Uncharacterized protein n=1 Tax=Theileria equi strain WA TaxID=1537102 RepID=L0B2X6_THEEQ|nr:hypothetical protein BEWA_009900 [Theileria equi strain WA]AFZ81576.1 hypothetical protein BEWA_009900 [Theileria equi strain WA]|eukprot:XP_004831242.1 hypothetical protein BEWA_009900 [Theileria equi strain WA]
MIRNTLSRSFSLLRCAKSDTIRVNSLQQKGFLIENLPKSMLISNDILVQTFSRCGVEILSDEIHIMRNRFGHPLGRAMILTERISSPNFDFKFGNSATNDKNERINGKLLQFHNITLKNIQQLLIDNLPQETRVYACDEHEVKCFVEQCERYLTLSEDLRRLSRPEFFYSVVTVTGIPKSYGRSELSHTIYKHTTVLVNPSDIVFRFKHNGEQDSVAWVLCKNDTDVKKIIAKLQEVPVAKRYQYGSLMGASFLYSSRSSLFISHPSIDYILSKSKYQVFTVGWHSDVDEKELIYLTNSLKLFPKSVKLLKVPSNDGITEVCAFLECDRMRNTKKLMVRLQMIKRRWNIPETSPFFAYPKMADVNFKSHDGLYEYNDESFYSDLDEPVEY